MSKKCQLCKTAKATTKKASPKNPKVIFDVCRDCAVNFRTLIGK